MLELLFLLLPIAAGYGWYMGYRTARQKRHREANRLSRQYVTGLNLLLSDQSDKAVNHFIELLQVDDDTIDTHLALGNLFRSRGEVDRAIKIHQNLVARPNLALEQRNIALQQLAKDYTVAGILDRAEKILKQLIDEPEHTEAALLQLVAIYQQTREWEKAIQYSKSLVRKGKKKFKYDIAYYYCELAAQELADNNVNAGKQYLKKALSNDKGCVRASIMTAELFIKEQNYRSAIDQLESILEQDIHFVSEVLPMLSECYEALNEEGALFEFLQLAIEKGSGASTELMLSNLIAKHEGTPIAQLYLTKQLLKNPTMKGFYHLMGYHAEEVEESRAKASLSTLQSLVGEQLKLKPNYRCTKCGFSAKRLFWQCPSCKKWGKIKPIRGLDGE